MSPSRPRTSAFCGISLDGFLARRDGKLDWLTPFEGEEHGYSDFISTVDGVLIGRATYDFLVSVLETGTPSPFGARKLLVLTHRPASVRWGERFFEGDAASALAALSDCRHVYVDGGAVIRQFVAARLLDEMTISIMPVLLGDGLPLWGGVAKESGVVLEGARTFRNGIAQVRYRFAT